MNAIRKDEDLSPIHSYYVDQWDWELVIEKKERTLEKLKSIVTKIYESFKELEKKMHDLYKDLPICLPDSIKFMTTQELEDLYPDLDPSEREKKITQKHKAVFLMKIGKVLKSGKVHDFRAADYDDWELNGDILFYYEELDDVFEISSMGIRVSEDSLKSQLKTLNQEKKESLFFHKKILNKELPYTIGGGIGQSRVCMFFLKKIHIGEVQSSVWDAKNLDYFNKKNINYL